METEKETKLKSQFKKVYLDTIKHEEDIERWIKSGKRKQGDIRRSIQRLETKYQTLCDLKKKLGKNRVIGIQIVLNKQINLGMIRDKIDKLYYLSGINPQRDDDSKYDKIELVTDIPGNEQLVYHIEKRTKSRIPVLGHFIDKFYILKNKIKENRELKKENKGKKNSKLKNLAAIIVAGAIALFGGTTVGDSNNNIKENNNNNAYVDTNRENNDAFKETIYIKALQEDETKNIEQESTQNKVEETRPTQIKEEETEKINVQKNLDDDESIDTVFIVKAGTEYTEVSDGSGNVGYFSKDNRVSVYCRAAVKTDEYGNKSIISTKAKQTWKDFAKENNIDYNEFKEYIENNPNVQEMVALDSEDGKKEYGWVPIDKLEKVEEIER